MQWQTHWGAPKPRAFAHAGSLCSLAKRSHLQDFFARPYCTKPIQHPTSIFTFQAASVTIFVPLLCNACPQPAFHAVHQPTKHGPRHILQCAHHTLLELFKRLAALAIHFGLSPSPNILNGVQIRVVARPSMQRRHLHARVGLLPSFDHI